MFSLNCKKLEFGERFVLLQYFVAHPVSAILVSWQNLISHAQSGTRRPHKVFYLDIFGPSKNLHQQWKYTCHLSFSAVPTLFFLHPTHFDPRTEPNRNREAQVLSSTTHSRRSSTTLWDLPSGTHCTDRATTLSVPARGAWGGWMLDAGRSKTMGSGALGINLLIAFWETP